MLNVDFSAVSLKLGRRGAKVSVFDPVRRKWVILTPEEHVRQLVLGYLGDAMRYPLPLISVEKTIQVGTLARRYDIVVYGRNHVPWLLAECKSPETDITEQALHQLLHYQSVVQARYWLLTNGRQSFCADAFDGSVRWLASLPAYDF